MNNLILPILVYFIIMQAFFLSLHFLTIKNAHHSSNRYLGLLLLSFSLSTLSFRMIFDCPKIGFPAIKYLYIAHLTLSLSMYVFLLLYTECVNGERKSGPHLYHILMIAFYLAFCLMTIEEVPRLLHHDLRLYTALSCVKVCLYLYYLILIVVKIKKATPEASFRRNFPHLLQMVLLGCFFLLWLIELLVLLSIWLGIIKVIYQFIIFTFTVVPFIFVNTILILALKKPVIYSAKQNAPSWSVKEEDKNKYLKGFKRLMEKEEMYKVPNLTLNKISEQLQINPKYLSSVLNQSLHGSFPHIVNNYRIEASKQLLENDYDMTIQQIMYEVGYNSKSVFNYHFKRVTGHTPSEYKIKHSKIMN